MDSTTSIATLTDLSFIAGTYKEFTFDIYDGDGSAVDCSSYSFQWLLSPYGQPSITTLSRSGLFSGTNRYTVYLYTEDTINLSGKYVQQPVLMVASGYEFRMAQGYITIIPSLPI